MNKHKVSPTLSCSTIKLFSEFVTERDLLKFLNVNKKFRTIALKKVIADLQSMKNKVKEEDKLIEQKKKRELKIVNKLNDIEEDFDIEEDCLATCVSCGKTYSSDNIVPHLKMCKNRSKINSSCDSSCKTDLSKIDIFEQNLCKNLGSKLEYVIDGKKYQISLGKEEERKSDKECNMCLETFPLDEKNFIFPSSCDCIFHLPCIKSHIVSSIGERKIPICPTIECKKELDPKCIDRVLTKEKKFKELYEKYCIERYTTENQDVNCCPTPDCKYLFFFSEGENDFWCPECEKRYCLSCKSEFHEGISCQKFMKNRDISYLDQKFESFVKGKKFKMCGKCKRWVEKITGCNHMTCICKNKFCYVCGENFKNGRFDCKCRPNNLSRLFGRR